MRALVTGAAGFIGSHLVERLLELGHDVVGIDSFTDYYATFLKRRNLAPAQSHPSYRFVEGDLITADVRRLMEGADWVFHEAAQAGVRASWGATFDIYTRDNVLATQRVLEAAKGSGITKLVYASSSSVYGDAESYPTTESATPQPLSPYGVTKLAAEHLCYLYWRNYGVPTVSLRYFSVYGPRQRPDMAFHIFGRALLQRAPIRIYGDGLQTRDFTFVSDVVAANVQAAQQGPPGSVLNVGGGARVGLREALRHLERLTGTAAEIHYQPMQRGDARHTSADIHRAAEALGYQPKVGLAAGLAAEVEWLRGLVDLPAGAAVDHQ
ncbi:MAG: NAD-dependent epimerase/dehydratase family protein [Dehalococcoidia bacterium]|nr:NAD-dependent epimerase/dehydratase family protein [Dehalococcoidia bacterium]